MTDPLDSTLQELTAAIRTRRVSPVEVVEAHIAHIETVNPLVNALVAARFDEARDEARSAEQRLASASPEELPPLFGVPCTIKDFYAVRGLPQTGGLVRRRDEIPERDAIVVERLRNAGAIVLGVTNVPEGGLWLESDNRVYGRTNNPWDVTRTAGGSSGGEGALIGAGASPFGMGSDIGGSIRLPAAFCGVAGHKPTARLVPNHGHWPPLSGEHAGYLVCGPLARSAHDLMPLLRVIAGPDERDAEARPLELGAPSDVRLDRLRVFVVEDGPVKPAGVVRDAVRRAARALEDRGATVRPARRGMLAEAFWIWAAMMDDAGSANYAELVSGDPNLPVLRELLRVARGRSNHTLPVLAVVAAQKLLGRLPGRGLDGSISLGRALQREIESQLGDDGVLLVPPYSRPAPRHMAPLLTPFDAGFTAVFNVLGLPGTQVPTGFDHRGLPVGVQVIGKRGKDHLTIAVACAIEDALGRLGRARPELAPERSPLSGRAPRAST